MVINGALRDILANAIDTEMNSGSNPEARFCNAAMTAAYATAPLNATAVFGPASGGDCEIALSGSATSTGAVTSGTVGRILFYKNGTAAIGSWELQFGVDTTAPADIVMPDNTLTTADTVKITSLTVTVPAGAAST
jgi:hypothetical protein